MHFSLANVVHDMKFIGSLIFIWSLRIFGSIPLINIPIKPLILEIDVESNSFNIPENLIQYWSKASTSGFHILESIAICFSRA